MKKSDLVDAAGGRCRFEVCADSLDAVAKAIAGGADRVELCRDLDTAGLTAADTHISQAVMMARNAGRPFAVMALVRPRPGDFVYDSAEKDDMLDTIARLCRLGVDGVVVGALDSSGAVDAGWLRQATALAHSAGAQVTFHRAFDYVTDFALQLDTLVDIGVDRVLTSGCPTCAADGIDTLSMLVRRARGRIIVMPGGGVRSSNIEAIHRRAGATEYHSSCQCAAAAGSQVTDIDEIRRMTRIIKLLN